MRVQAEIRTVNNNSGISKKTGKEYSFNELYFIDVEAERPEILKAIVHENDVNAVRALVGKTVPCHFFMNSGGLRFGGQVVQAQKAVNQ